MRAQHFIPHGPLQRKLGIRRKFLGRSVGSMNLRVPFFCPAVMLFFQHLDAGPFGNLKRLLCEVDTDQNGQLISGANDLVDVPKRLTHMSNANGPTFEDYDNVGPYSIHSCSQRLQTRGHEMLELGLQNVSKNLRGHRARTPNVHVERPAADLSDRAAYR